MSASIESTANDLYSAGKWDEGHAALRQLIEQAASDTDRARLRVELIGRYTQEDYRRGLRNREARREELTALFDELERINDDELTAEACLQRGIACHVEFIMAADRSRGAEEKENLTRAAELFEAAGRTDDAAFALASVGVYHHVVERDRETAREILTRAYEMTATDRLTHARFEACRHLGQIQQELGDPAGALELLEESRRQIDVPGQEGRLPAAHHALGFARMEAGDLEGAERDLAIAREWAERFDSKLMLLFIAKTETELGILRIAPGVAGRTHP